MILQSLRKRGLLSSLTQSKPCAMHGEGRGNGTSHEGWLRSWMLNRLVRRSGSFLHRHPSIHRPTDPPRSGMPRLVQFCRAWCASGSAEPTKRKCSKSQNGKAVIPNSIDAMVHTSPQPWQIQCGQDHKVSQRILSVVRWRLGRLRAKGS